MSWLIITVVIISVMLAAYVAIWSYCTPAGQAYHEAARGYRDQPTEAELRDAIGSLTAAIYAVRDRHHPIPADPNHDDGTRICFECVEAWPCGTVLDLKDIP